MLPTDPYYVISYQYDLIGDIESVWDDYAGTGVNVGVYDDGMDYNHVDLSSNYDSSLHFWYWGSEHDPFPESSDDWHGTAVAGVLGATGNNGEGGLGVVHSKVLDFQGF